MTSMPSPTEPSKSTSPERVMSLDALRGFDMFWIMGGDLLVRSILKVGGWSFSDPLAAQFEHEPWEGFRFYDLIYPLFLFLVGCVIPYSLHRFREQPAQAYGRIVRRTLLLILLGMLNNGLLQFQWEQMRWTGVLQRIGVCYGIAAAIWLHSRVRSQAILLVAILLGYWAILAFVPAPGGTAGDLSIAGNLGGYLDRHFLPGRILPEYYGQGDNEGLLSTIPAIATALLGVLTGTWLRTAYRPWQKCVGLFLAAATCLPLGYGWGSLFPVIKNLWTSSYVLVAGGWSLLLLAGFYLLIDVWQLRRWAWFFLVIGMNAVTIYVVPEFLDFERISRFFLGGVMDLAGSWGPPVMYVGILAAEWILLWFLYRNRMFLRV